MAHPADVGICNVALAQIGVEPIESLLDTSQAGRLCNLFYDRTRDDLQASYRWHFCLSRIALVKNTASPIFGFESSFALPVDWLRVWEIDQTEIAWSIEGQNLVADTDAVSIKYNRRIDNPGFFDEGFRRALELKIASQIAFPLTRQLSVTEAFESLFQLAIDTARSLNSMEMSPEVTGPGDETLILTRLRSARAPFTSSGG